MVNGRPHDLHCARFPWLHAELGDLDLDYTVVARQIDTCASTRGAMRLRMDSGNCPLKRWLEKLLVIELSFRGANNVTRDSMTGAYLTKQSV